VLVLDEPVVVAAVPGLVVGVAAAVVVVVVVMVVVVVAVLLLLLLAAVVVAEMVGWVCWWLGFVVRVWWWCVLVLPTCEDAVVAVVVGEFGVESLLELQWKPATEPVPSAGHMMSHSLTPGRGSWGVAVAKSEQVLS